MGKGGERRDLFLGFKIEGDCLEVFFGDDSCCAVNGGQISIKKYVR